MKSRKPRVKCELREFTLYHNVGYVGWVTRLSDHPKLGQPRAESATRTSLILRIDFERKEMETLNTIYWWE